MFRGTTPLALLTTPAAALPTLQLFAATAPFASAHTSRHVEAKTLPEIDPLTMTLRDESGALRARRPVGGRAGTGGPTGSRDRHRPADAAPQAPDRPAPDATAAIPPPNTPGAAYARASRPAADRSTAALQSFRH
ncbi:hypothetical protein [Streptomyces sp. MUM 2J]|uniref:hypothetical protein n=1 Tax=Streptomyces sp. MUM 2J TaxID=2791987 RepID=UPI001F0404FE|nr:hypothetical protein [Streptomyces sp. MUM 2J]MCH0561661.1 hypothetical protein [Streptomyces sp. MUM 2J]